MPQMLEVSRSRGTTLLGVFWVVKQRREGDTHHSVADFAIAAFALAVLTSLTQSTPENAGRILCLAHKDCGEDMGKNLEKSWQGELRQGKQGSNSKFVAKSAGVAQ